jgi:carbonic anhydrase
VLDEVLAANRTYAAGFCDKGKLAMPRARRFAIFTCMDAQVTRNGVGTSEFGGRAEGDLLG